MTDRFTDLADQGDGSATERLHALFDRAWARAMEESPESATYTGWPDHHDRWTDLSIEAVERRRAQVGDALAVLRTIDPGTLDDQDRRSHAMFRSLEEGAVAESAYPGHLLPLNQLEGPQIDPAFLLSVMPRETRRHHDDILARLRRLADLVDQTIDLLAGGMAAGITQPAVCLRAVPSQVEPHLLDDPMSNPELTALAGLPAEVLEEARAIVRDSAAPAFGRLHAFLLDHYLPAARSTVAWFDLPDGRDWYAERVRHHTTTGLSPEEIHQTGLAEVARITAEMDKVMEDTGFTGGRQAFAELLRTDPRFFFGSEAELLAAYRDIAKRIDPQIPRLFSRLPRLPFGISPVPPDQAPAQPAAYYLPGSPELGRAGMFYANTSELGSRPSWNMESICLHEAVPGHHFQIALAQETEGLPLFRRQSLSCTAYVEGWGLYCESLGADLGMYADPYQRFGALDAELLRACRLVIDTGVHALGWTRDRAIEFFTSTSPSPQHELVVEVDRYIVWPGQALAYKVGELRILELRRRAAARMGEGFDLRGFHDAVLRHGALPLDLLDAVVDQWIQSAAT